MANTTYTFRPKSTTQLANWNDPTAWIGGVVPNSPDADVVIPLATLSGGGTYMSFITIGTGEVFTEYSLTVAGNGVNLFGTLSLADALTNLQQSSVQLFGGTLTAGSIVNGGNIGGYGQVTVSGSLTNDYQINAANGDLVVTAHGLVNNGLLSAGSGHLVVNVDPGGFANLVGTTLSGGSYVASGGGALELNVGGPIATNAATISLGLNGGGSMASFDPSSGGYVLLQSSLHSVATTGILSLAGQTWNWGSLSIDGSLTLANATLTSPQLTVGAGGHISGSGTIAAPILNAGTITASGTASGSVLDIAGSVTGSGNLVIAQGTYAFGTQNVTPTLELGGATSQAVAFSNTIGALVLDDPQSFTGTIAPSSLFNQISTGDQIILSGLSLAGLQGYSYTGNASGGVLSLQEASGTTDLHIVGEYNAGSFNFAEGPQFLTTSPPSLKVTVGGLVKLVNDTGASSTDNVTSDPTVTERAYANAMVKLVVDGTPLADTLQADAQGVWSYTPTGLADGTHTIVASEFVYGPSATTVPLGTASLTFVLDSHPAAAPETYGEAYVALAGQTLVATVADGVLADDEAATTTTVQTGPAHGALQLNGDGSFSYTPTAGYSGIDSFNYHVSGGSGATDNGQALVYVVPTAIGASTTLDLLALNAEEQIAATYVSFFGRGADADGFAFWVDQFTAGAGQQAPGTLFANIASSFGVSAEAQGLYPFLAHPEGASDGEIGTFLDSVYNNLFNRPSDAGGLAYWTDQIHQTLAAGEYVGSVLVDIISGTQNTATGQDITTLMSKVAVGLSYVHEQEQLGTTWSYAADGANAIALLDAVTAQPQTVLVGIAQAHDMVLADVH